ncbi:hypothetical protein BGW36DRAFT_303633, partial [Talaromyces proteolyticus]
QGKFEEAERMHRLVFVGLEMALGSEHPYTFYAVNQIGLALGKQGKYEKASEMHRYAFNGLKRVLDPEHPETIYSVNSMNLSHEITLNKE